MFRRVSLVNSARNLLAQIRPASFKASFAQYIQSIYAVEFTRFRRLSQPILPVKRVYFEQISLLYSTFNMFYLLFIPFLSNSGSATRSVSNQPMMRDVSRGSIRKLFFVANFFTASSRGRRMSMPRFPRERARIHSDRSIRQTKRLLVLDIESVIRPAAVSGTISGKADVAVLECINQLLTLFLADISHSNKP